LKQLLIIEDDTNLRNVITELFSENGFNVLSANNGVEGIKLAKKFIPDIIISDLLMPGMDGFRVKEILSEDRITSTIPFVYLTGQNEIKDMRRGMELGADDYIVKPVKAGILLELILKRLARIENLKANIKSQPETVNKKFLLKSGKENLFVSFDDITVISADGYYSNVHLLNRKKITLKRTLKTWLTMLPDNKFIQVHRKIIINFNMIEKLDKWEKGTYVAQIKNYNYPVYFSQRCSQKLRKQLSIK
jgi:DNA-binding LytR/AlgR family response regulator